MGGSAYGYVGIMGRLLLRVAQVQPLVPPHTFTAASITLLYQMIDAAICDFAPEWNMGATLALVICLWFMFTIHLQEFHDADGDRTSKRKTLP